MSIHQFNPEVHRFSAPIEFPDGSIGSVPFDRLPTPGDCMPGGVIFDSLPPGSRFLLPDIILPVKGATAKSKTDYFDLTPGVQIHKRDPLLIGPSTDREVTNIIGKHIRSLGNSYSSTVPIETIARRVMNPRDRLSGLDEKTRRKILRTMKDADSVLTSFLIQQGLLQTDARAATIKRVRESSAVVTTGYRLSY